MPKTLDLKTTINLPRTSFSNGVAAEIVWNGTETAGTYTPASQFTQYESLNLNGGPAPAPMPISGGATVPIGELPIILEAGQRP